MPGSQVEVQVLLSHPKKSGGCTGPSHTAPACSLLHRTQHLCRVPRNHPLSPTALVSNTDFTESLTGRRSITHPTEYSPENSSTQSPPSPANWEPPLLSVHS